MRTLDLQERKAAQYYVNSSDSNTTKHHDRFHNGEPHKTNFFKLPGDVKKSQIEKYNASIRYALLQTKKEIARLTEIKAKCEEQLTETNESLNDLLEYEAWLRTYRLGIEEYEAKEIFDE